VANRFAEPQEGTGRRLVDLVPLSPTSLSPFTTFIESGAQQSATGPRSVLMRSGPSVGVLVEEGATLQPEGATTTAAGPGPFLSSAAGENLAHPATSAARHGQPLSPTAGEGATTTVAGPRPSLPRSAAGEYPATSAAGPGHHSSVVRRWWTKDLDHLSRLPLARTMQPSQPNLDHLFHLPPAKTSRSPWPDLDHLSRMLLARTPRRRPTPA
jgi:hypothetical protein